LAKQNVIDNETPLRLPSWRESSCFISPNKRPKTVLIIRKYG
jgi:hypothetical protein